MFATLAVGGCLADLVSKSIVFSQLGGPSGGHSIHWIVDGYFGLETALNHGALFGFGQHMVWLFASMSFIAIGGIVYWLGFKDGVNDWLLTLTLGLVTGGILGNLYDRLGIWSGFEIFAVRDWIRFSYPITDASGLRDVTTYVWPNFNIADSLLVCGAVLLFLHSFQQPEMQSEKSS